MARDASDAQRAADWLAAIRNHHTAPVRAVIGKQSWFGAAYWRQHVCQPHERIVTEGPMVAGTELFEYRFMLLGQRPLHSRRQDRQVFVYDLPEDRRQPRAACYAPGNEWYVSYYNVSESRTEYAPFGPNFGLCLHEPMNFGYYKDWKIDTGERTPYVRRPMTIEYLDAPATPVASETSTHGEK